jgi:ribosomal-protein-alanine N-acetyltransferase
LDDSPGRSLPELVSLRLRLRPIALGDAEALWPYVSEPEISRYMSWAPHRTLDETRAFIADVLRRIDVGANATWVVLVDGGVAGIVSLIAVMRSHRALRYDKAELAFWLGAPYRGRGVATEACTLAMRYGFETLALNKITVAHVAQNDASHELIERLGFRRVGVERRHFCKGGVWFDHVGYELLAQEWRLGAAPDPFSA